MRSRNFTFISFGTILPIFQVPQISQAVASCPAYKFLRRQVRWSGIPIPLRIFLFVVIHIVKGFSIINEAEVDVFFSGILLLSLLYIECWQFDLWFLCLFKTQLVHLEVLGSELKPSFKILSITLLACEMSTIVHGVLQAKLLE